MLLSSKFYNDDYMNALDDIPDKSVDVVITDPPYKFTSTKGGGFYAKDNPDKQREYLDSLQNLKCADFNPKLFLYMIKPKLKKIYIYTLFAINIFLRITYSGLKTTSVHMMFL